jgi:uncharacterized membrane protein
MRAVCKRQLASIVLIIVGLFAAHGACAQTLAGYWSLIDGTGNKAGDNLGNTYTPFPVNGTSWGSGHGGEDVSATSASGRYIRIPAIDLSSTHSVTVAFRSKRIYSRTGGHALLQSTIDFTQSTTGFAVFPDDSTCAGIQAAIKGDVGVTANCYGQPSSGEWHHFALVFDKTQSAGDQVALYVDGVFQNPTRSLSASTNSNDFGNNPIWLFLRGGTGMFDSEQIDDLRLYKVALHAAEIQRIYHGAALISLVVSPASVSIPSGTAHRFTATGTYADGSRRDLTSSVSWSSVATTVATIAHDGSTIGMGEGETTIKAALAGLSASARITVTTAQTSMNMALAQSIPSELSGDGVGLDTHGVHDNGSQANNQVAVSIGTPTAGDLITCEVTFDGHNGNALVSLTDNNNGSYAAAVRVHLNITLIQWFGIYYKQAAVGSPTTVTLKTTNSQPWSAVSCQSWKGMAASNALDAAFVQSQDALASNPTTGSSRTPSGNGELIIAGLGLYFAGAPTAGTNYALIDAAPATQWWPEYWIQTNASPTAGNYSQSSEYFTDMMAAFKPALTSSFTITSSPSSLSVVQGHSGTTTIGTTVNGSFDNPILLSVSGVPAGTSARFSVNPIPAPGTGNSVLTLNAGSNTAVGTYPITITGTGGGLQQSTTVRLTVTTTGTFTIRASPSALTIVQGHSGTSTISTAVSGGFNKAITLSASGVPSGTTVSFSPDPIPPPGAGNSRLILTVGSNTGAGTYNIVITGSGGGLQHSATVSLTVTAAANFTVAASPATLRFIRGNQAASTITTSVSGGFNNAITLSASGVPSGTTVSFSTNPIPAPGSGSSTMTIVVGTTTRTGTYSSTITGTGGGLQRSTTVTLTVGAQVALAWTASVSHVVGYNAYRATESNGPYTRLNIGLITGTTYMDQKAQSGVTYYYVTTAVNAQGVESVYSNQAVASVP